MNGSGRTPKRKEAERQRSLDIERWLKGKFREGFVKMRDCFEACDTKKTGSVSAWNGASCTQRLKPIVHVYIGLLLGVGPCVTGWDGCGFKSGFLGVIQLF